MKNILTLLTSVLLLASCSAPKYSYYFDHYDYQSGKKKLNAEKRLLAANETVTEEVATMESPLLIEKGSVTAHVGENAVTPIKKAAPTAENKVLEKKYSDLTKAEKKEFRQALKKEIKKYAKAKKAGDSIKDTQTLDHNLKMAIIFGAVALTLSFFGGVNSVFWVASVVALVIGVVFFIKWIAEQ